ncbi:hypothetical protein [Candidatus Viridilinea mediisalina]|uniref:Uncharacterized protein n=1 Tax=Candidatus Viridilinea mediisalina TaxID=2024553 RepID=A0A2A6RFQ2_9CHLR|nr:hypothetical protein [Candidatus Viridilinea mediisalina]PDW01709.1 hypothetical protein CJ255_17785 [Candidatus Viridilinea mediisalina]
MATQRGGDETDAAAVPLHDGGHDERAAFVPVPVSEMQQVIMRLQKVCRDIGSRHAREALRILQTYADKDSSS